MDLLFYSISIITIIILVMYVRMIVNYVIKWNSIESFEIKNHASSFKTTVSIIVAARNEEGNIIDLLQCIASQNYPNSLFEIYVVDDHSEDKTTGVVDKFIAQNVSVQIKLIQLQKINPELKNKKAAIQQGIEQSTGELIITTDADCIMNENWLATIVSYYELHKPQMIVCPVILSGESFFEKLQRLEFLSLIGITASSIKAGKPLMCNGANLAYTRKIFFETGGFENNTLMATGDDTFLMFNIWKLNNHHIHFLKSNDATVTTPAQKNISSFLQQRARWASKTTQYNLPHVSLTGYFITAINFMILILLALSFFKLKFLLLLFSLFSIKLIVDGNYLFKVASYFKQKQLNSLLLLLITAMLYPFYILYISLKSQRGHYQWKGRIFAKK
ncbi:MAG: glycosyltransferase [Bacteroidia bacterium]